MNISFAKLDLPKKGAYAVFAAQRGELSPSAKAADKKTKGALSRVAKHAGFKGEKGQTVALAAPGGLDADRLILVGLGPVKQLGALDFERLGAKLYGKLAASGDRQLSIAVDDMEGLGIETSEAAARLAAGVKLRSYRFDRYRTKEPKSKKPTLKKTVIMADAPGAARNAFRGLDQVISGVFLTRDLVSEPANVLHPESFAERIAALEEDGIKVTVLGEKQMAKLGMGALLGVGQGSEKESKLAVMEWNGALDGEGGAPVALVGKGVTFDTGGISLKPGAGMEQMKWDMGGAGIVVGAMKALAAREAKAHVVGIVGLVENMPSHNAQRPGDVVTSADGQTIEVINTDAEGRLVLADALWYAQEEYKPQAIIDLATLTGAMIISLGHEYAGFFTDSDTLADQLNAAAAATGDRVWRLPLHENYDKLINSPIADMKNVGPRGAGSITAAQFLKRFIKKVDWAHIDVAGMVWDDKDGPLYEKGATGYGVRLLDRWVAENYEQGD